MNFIIKKKSHADEEYLGKFVNHFLSLQKLNVLVFKPEYLRCFVNFSEIFTQNPEIEVLNSLN